MDDLDSILLYVPRIDKGEVIDYFLDQMSKYESEGIYDVRTKSFRDTIQYCEKKYDKRINVRV